MVSPLPSLTDCPHIWPRLLIRLRMRPHLNSSHSTIKFEFEAGESFNFETKSVNFLDLTIWIDENGCIQTTLYQKSCRVVAYLLPSSCHPTFICRNIPFSLAYRLKRIESTIAGFERNMEKLREELVGWGYRRTLVESCFERIRVLDRLKSLA